MSEKMDYIDRTDLRNVKVWGWDRIKAILSHQIDKFCHLTKWDELKSIPLEVVFRNLDPDMFNTSHQMMSDDGEYEKMWIKIYPNVDWFQMFRIMTDVVKMQNGIDKLVLKYNKPIEKFHEYCENPTYDGLISFLRKKSTEIITDKDVTLKWNHVHDALIFADMFNFYINIHSWRS